MLATPAQSGTVSEEMDMGAKDGVSRCKLNCRTARLVSIGVSAAFLLIMVLALTNEDSPAPAALSVLVVLGLNIVASFVAWRYPRIGGMVVQVAAVALGVAVYVSSTTFGLGPSSLITSLIYAIPFLVVGLFFARCASNSSENFNE